MDHQRIEELGVAESYVLGRLAAADEEAFEAHLVTCGACRERVAWVEELQGSLQALAAEEGSRAVRLGVLAHLARFARGGRPARLGIAAAAAFALCLVLALILAFEEARWRGQLAAARTAAVRSAARAAPAAPPAPRATLPTPASEPDRAAERERLAAQLSRRDGELRRAEGVVEELRARLAEVERPQVNTVIASLGLVRGQETPNRVLLAPRPGWIVLSIELPAPGAGAWHAALVDGSGRTAWSGGGLRPTANDTLVLSLPSDLLAPGGHRLLLDRPGDPPQHSEVPFEVVKP